MKRTQFSEEQIIGILKEAEQAVALEFAHQSNGYRHTRTRVLEARLR